MFYIKNKTNKSRPKLKTFQIGDSPGFGVVFNWEIFTNAKIRRRKLWIFADELLLLFEEKTEIFIDLP